MELQRERIVFDHHDKVLKWRRDELLRIFPEMTVEQAEHLAVKGDRVNLLQDALRLHEKGCPANLAFDILR